jgi:drug/metabolite transporter (DMT)-like permease
VCGIALAVIAAALLSAEPEERRGPLFGRALILATAAGIGFGVSLVLFAAASHHSGYWPVLSARVAAFTAICLAILTRRSLASLSEVPKLPAASAGLLDVGATAVLLAALRGNLTAVVAPVASLAPGFTTFHAWWYLHERISRVQMLGVALALTGLGLIATA